MSLSEYRISVGGALPASDGAGTGRASYPDVSMVCGTIEGDPADPTNTTITNPVLIVEVLSPSTEEDDRGTTWQHYQLLPSLAEYVLVSQGAPRVEVHRPLDAGGWEYRDVRDGAIELRSGATLDLDRLAVGAFFDPDDVGCDERGEGRLAKPAGQHAAHRASSSSSNAHTLLGPG